VLFRIPFGVAVGIWLLLCSVAEAQLTRKPLSVEDVEYLLGKVSPPKVAEVVKKQGVNFELTEAIQERLRRAGVTAEVVQAIKEAEVDQKQQRLVELLAQARQQLAAGLLTTPRGGNALETYREILRLVPGHEEALEGIRELKGRYVQWAEAAKQRGEWAQAQVHYEKALSIDHQDEALKAKLREIKERVARPPAVPAPPGESVVAAPSVSGRDGREMVSVPAGEFYMGCNEQVDGECDSDEKPGRRVYVDAFRIDRTEVPVTAYRRCAQAGACTPPNTGGACNWGQGGQEDHPINCVDWNQAQAYCRWAGKRDCRPRQNGRRRHAGQTDASIPGGISGRHGRPIQVGMRMDIPRQRRWDHCQQVPHRTVRWTWRGTCGSGCRIGIAATTIARGLGGTRQDRIVGNTVSCAAARGAAARGALVRPTAAGAPQATATPTPVFAAPSSSLF